MKKKKFTVLIMPDEGSTLEVSGFATAQYAASTGAFRAREILRLRESVRSVEVVVLDDSREAIEGEIFTRNTL